MKRFFKKADRILSELPPFANDCDKRAALNRHLRLDKEDTRAIIKELKKIK